jgi:chromosome segregation ATPase
MGLELWEGVAAAGTAALGAIGGGFWSRRSREERDATSASALAKAYGELVDDLREDVKDSREHIRRQDAELASLRDELRAVREARDSELNTVRQELADVRAENTRLRDRIATLEAHGRQPAPAK